MSLPSSLSMSWSFRRTLQVFLIALLTLAVTFTPGLFAQDHVVSPADLQKDVQAVSVSRQQAMTELDHLYSSPQGQKALETLHVSNQQVQKAVASLDDADLARLSARAERAQNDFAAGRVSDRDLILLALGVLVIILIIVAVH
jgi:hypothetical protein